ncbi:MAG: class I SAM-dependent methyltransferase [Planctomycetota bacterium]
MPAPIRSFPGPFRPDSKVDLSGLSAALERQGFTREALESKGIIGTKSAAEWDRMNRMLDFKPELRTLIHLFMLAKTLPIADVNAALGAGLVASLVECGMLHKSPAGAEGLAAEGALLPLSGLFTMGDFSSIETGRTMASDHVPCISPAATLVASLSVRVPCDRALDLCCGSGYHALLAASHAREVVGTDINDRSLNFAAMSSRLNALTNIEWRKGSFFEPLEGETFDLIDANPPFVISPATDLIFRDSGMLGDKVSETIIRRLPSMLRENGWASMLFNWHHKSADDWEDKPRQWLPDSGCDVWLLRFRSDDPQAYAIGWLRTGLPAGKDPDPARLPEWLAYYKRIGAEVLSLGAVIIRRRTPASGAAPNWFKADTLPTRDDHPSASDQIQRVFAGETALRGPRGDAAVLDLKPRLADGITLEQTSSQSNGAWKPSVSRLVQTGGITLRCGLDEALAAVVARCDGSRTARDAAQSVAKERGLGDGPEAALGAVPILAWLVRQGFFDLEPA